MLTPTEYEHGQLFFREGEESDVAYLIIKGNVEIFKQTESGTVLLTRLGAGELFGEMGLVNGTARTASAAADGDTTVKPVSREVLSQLLAQCPVEIAQMLRAMMHRLHENNQKISRLVDKTNQFQLVSDTPAEIKRLTLLPLSNTVKEHLGKGMVIDLPFRVGSGGPMQDHSLNMNHLAITGNESDQLSNSHFVIEKTAEGICVKDLGSPAGCIVNNIEIGSQKDSDHVNLSPGDNIIIAGGNDSPYRFCLTWES